MKNRKRKLANLSYKCVDLTAFARGPLAKGARSVKLRGDDVQPGGLAHGRGSAEDNCFGQIT